MYLFTIRTLFCNSFNTLFFLKTQSILLSIPLRQRTRSSRDKPKETPSILHLNSRVFQSIATRSTPPDQKATDKTLLYVPSHPVEGPSPCCSSQGPSKLSFLSLSRRSHLPIDSVLLPRLSLPLGLSKRLERVDTYSLLSPPSTKALSFEEHSKKCPLLLLPRPRPRGHLLPIKVLLPCSLVYVQSTLDSFIHTLQKIQTIQLKKTLLLHCLASPTPWPLSRVRPLSWEHKRTLSP